MLRLHVAILGQNRAGKLKRALVTKSVSTVDAVVQQLGYAAVSRIRQGLEMAYSTVRLPCPVALTCVPVVAAMSIRAKGEGSGDEKESKLFEDRPTRARQGFAKVSRPPVSGMGRSSRRQSCSCFCFDSSTRLTS